MGGALKSAPLFVFECTGGIFISNLRLQPTLKWEALGDLYQLENKEQYPLKEWEEAVSYLLGCEVRFANYEDIGKSLKPFSLKVR